MSPRLTFHTSLFVFFFGGALFYVVGHISSMWHLIMSALTDDPVSYTNIYVCAVAIGALCGIVMSASGTLRYTGAHLLLMPLCFVYGYHGNLPWTPILMVFILFATAYLLLVLTYEIERKNEERIRADMAKLRSE